ncbi:hypothetical protein SAMN06295974_3814 [Plantibacter flavus]|uniref:Uncharacterized protein n=1 Tax=Plantibacter flavus TaxID=150123 RepID=A0A3N2BLA5_9MICO|nr:hypothetical protein [Plantibacter flavus]ROR76039.1 hypothetical protein EDD42_3992 [Plantibacter flavus]SMG49070.1 hypothetical protein SAMN06295974_3814 [Plantibacter flavus]
MSAGNFDGLRSAVVDASEAGSWMEARKEWEIIGAEESVALKGVCRCGQARLRMLFTIGNRLNGREIAPVGSSCINNFLRSDLNDEVEILSRISKLRLAILDGTPTQLDGKYFSRVLVKHFEAVGVITTKEHQFLLDIFNKSASGKGALSVKQQSYLDSLTIGKIGPYVLHHPKLT